VCNTCAMYFVVLVVGVNGWGLHLVGSQVCCTTQLLLPGTIIKPFVLVVW
jgi:uncharacterized membrane protein